MARSLKESYKSRQVATLKQRLSVVDKHIIIESKHARLLVEAMDQDDLNKVSAIVQKLDSIKSAVGSDLPSLTNAIAQAQAEINKYTAGGPIANAWTKLKGKVGIDNPVVKIATFASALEQGFQQLPQILKNNGIDMKQLANDGNVKLIDAITQQLSKQPEKKLGEDSQGSSTPNVKDIANTNKPGGSGEAQEKVKTITDQIRKALSPSGIFGAFKKIPYIDGDALAQDLTNAKVSTLNQVSKVIRSGPQTSEVAPDMKSAVSGTGDAQTKSTGPEQPSSPSGQTSTSEPSKTTTSPAGSTSAGQVPPNGPGEKRGGGSQSTTKKVDPSTIQDMANFISKKTKIDPETVLKIVNALNDSQKLVSLRIDQNTSDRI